MLQSKFGIKFFQIFRTLSIVIKLALGCVFSETPRDQRTFFHKGGPLKPGVKQLVHKGVKVKISAGRLEHKEGYYMPDVTVQNSLLWLVAKI